MAFVVVAGEQSGVGRLDALAGGSSGVLRIWYMVENSYLLWDSRHSFCLVPHSKWPSDEREYRFLTAHATIRQNENATFPTTRQNLDISSQSVDRASEYYAPDSVFLKHPLFL
jgi:hypothetical protein